MRKFYIICENLYANFNTLYYMRNFYIRTLYANIIYAKIYEHLRNLNRKLNR
jgi:hypothetical protein